jgi:hypothetical protein
MGFISIGKIDKNLIPIIVGCIFSFLSRLLFTYKGTILFDHPLIDNIAASLSKFFSFFPIVFMAIQSCRENQMIKRNKNLHKFKYIYTNKKSQINRGKYPYIILSSIIFFIQGSILFFTISLKTNVYIWNILITCIFFTLIFKVKLYRHHYLSIILIILTGFVLDLASENLQNDIVNNFTSLLLRFIREIVFSLHDIINKYAMENKFCSVHEIALYSGLICLILFLLFSLLSYHYWDLDNFSDYFNNFNITELLVLIAYFITQYGLYIGALLTNKNNTPCHIFIIYIFGQLAYYTNFSTNSIILIICLIFILFMSLIFNEIIEINFCGLSENTKKNILNRVLGEESNIKKNYDDVLIELEDNDSIY